MFDHPDAATLTVMERVFLQWGMEHRVGDRFGLMNASSSPVVNGLHEAMPPEGMIIEMCRTVSETVEPQDEFNCCIDHRFDPFQGYHLHEPELLRRPARDATR